MQTIEETLRRLTIGDPRLIAAIGDPGNRVPDLHRLDERTEALLRIGALVALDAPQSSYLVAVGEAQLAGAVMEDVLAVVVAVAGEVGSARVISAAPRIALAAGYDVEAALERIDYSDHELASSSSPRQDVGG
jgi:4-carboxymuconolactone decarboxylase